MSYLERKDDQRRLAVEALVDKFGREVLAYLYDALKNRDEAEELFIRTFLYTYRRFGRKGPSADERALILRNASDMLNSKPASDVDHASPSQTDFVDAQDITDSEDATATTPNEMAVEVTVTQSVPDVDENGGEPGIPVALRLRLSQLLTATAAQVRAEQRHRGPNWIGYACALTFVFAAAAIAYGTYHAASDKSAPAAHGASMASRALPTALRNLPVNAIAQYGLNDDQVTMAIDRFFASDKALFVPELVEREHKSFINLKRCDYQDSGNPLSKVMRSAGEIPLVRPVAGLEHKSSLGAPWQLSDWRIDVTGNWVVATVTWSKLHVQNSRTVQLYALYLPSGRSALVRTLRQNTGFADRFATAVGDGRVVIQSGFTNPVPGGGATIVSLPIEVYQLQGTDPLYAFGKVQNIRAPFGLMTNPTITGDQLVFQGFAGQADEPNAPSSAWYDLSWSGVLTKWWGPPIDGQPHWPVKGSSGIVYWVETTPDMRNEQNVQILMSPVSRAAGSAQSPALTLSASVPAFTVSGQCLVWIQTQGGTPQVVVARAN